MTTFIMKLNRKEAAGLKTLKTARTRTETVELTTFIMKLE